MNAKNVFLEIAREFGWGCKIPHCLGCEDLIPASSFSVRKYPHGYQIELYRRSKDKDEREKLAAYFPDKDPFIIRVGDLKNADLSFEYAWPNEVRIDFDLRDPESIGKLRKWIEDYSKWVPTSWRRFLKFIGWSS